MDIGRHNFAAWDDLFSRALVVVAARLAKNESAYRLELSNLYDSIIARDEQEALEYALNLADVFLFVADVSSRGMLDELNGEEGDPLVTPAEFVASLDSLKEQSGGDGTSRSVLRPG